MYKRQIEIGLANGLIERSQSDTVSPMHAVEQYGKIRVVMDSRKTNEQLCLYNYIFPKLSEEIEELAGGKYKVFSQTDLTSAFNQIEIAETSRHLLSFAVYTKKFRGTFRYTRMPFGIKPAPSVWASILDRSLEGINSGKSDRFMIKSFIDDIVIAAVDEEAMFEALGNLFGRLAEMNYKLSLPKSSFFADECEYCGIKCSGEGYCISEKRRRILKEYPDYDVGSRKKNSDLAHLGFYNWHRRFVKDYSKKDRAIRDIVKEYKNKKVSRADANKAIKEITDEMRQQILDCMLITPTKEDTVILQCDASGRAWGYACYCDRGVFSYGGGSFTPVSYTHLTLPTIYSV